MRMILRNRDARKARLGVSAEYAIVERRFTGIRDALVQFMEEHDGD